MAQPPTVLEAYTQMYRCLQRAQWYVVGSVAQGLLSSKRHENEHIILEGPQLMEAVWHGVGFLDETSLHAPVTDGEFSLLSLPSRTKDLEIHITLEKGYIGKMEVESVKQRVSDLVAEARKLRVGLAAALDIGGDEANMGDHASLRAAVAIDSWLMGLKDRMKRCTKHPVF